MGCREWCARPYVMHVLVPCKFCSCSWQEEAVQAGVANNGMGPIAQKLTQQEVPRLEGVGDFHVPTTHCLLPEAETLATRVGHVVVAQDWDRRQGHTCT